MRLATRKGISDEALDRIAKALEDPCAWEPSKVVVLGINTTAEKGGPAYEINSEITKMMNK